MTTGPRILLLLPQLPQDPSSGASRSTLSAAQFARDSGFEVRALATTATESGKFIDPVEFPRSLGVEPEIRPAAAGHFRELRYQHRGIPFTLLDTGKLNHIKCEKNHGRQIDLLLEAQLDSFAPEVVFTFGGLEPRIYIASNYRKLTGRSAASGGPDGRRSGAPGTQDPGRIHYPHTAVKDLNYRGL